MAKKKKGLFEVISGGRPLTGQYKNHQAVRPNTMSDTKREGTTLSWYQPASLEALGGGPQSTDYTCGKVEAVRRNYHAARGGGTGIRQVPLDLAIEPRGIQLKENK